MRDFRLKALDHFLARNQPTCGSPMLAELDYDDIRYFVRASETPSRSWDDVPEDVKRTFDCARADVALLCAERGCLASGREKGCLSGDAVVSDAEGECISRCLVGE